MPELRSAIPFVRLDGGEPQLRGHRCGRCDAVYLSQRRACGRCFGQELSETRLGETGRLYNYTIVYRSFPGVKVPFISATVDLDGGGTVRGNLADVDSTPEAIEFDMPVRVVFRDCGQTDSSGDTFLSHYFVPAGTGA